MTPSISEIRRELVLVCRERDRARKDRDNALNQWTKERVRMMQQLRDLRKRERVLIKLLTDYLAGELDETTVTAKLTKSRS